MADAPIPQPDKILNYPQNGELEFLFRKKLTSSDMRTGLILTSYSNYYLRHLPRPLLDVITGDGLTVWCYTPAIHHSGAVLKGHTTYFRFKKTGWEQISAANGFLTEQEIDCWSLYDAEDGPHGNLRFLIQSVGDHVVPEEAA
ncbi:uncharacterized protein LOC125315100 [Rhodamnia argentea]|uniref:Uncharacterized protein LOC125315100 n=1 Tax=Rhodamnia argentea TaxID=178133 RepID=A0ABM3HET7_9MYRT|nr:uncharacterized protein LOC125315100 [Rhodamnia argentea]